jgi:hypothetical protein
MFKPGPDSRYESHYKNTLELMLRFFLTLGLLITILHAACGQKVDLHPILIDTIYENILIVHKRYATLYFKQSDIQEYSSLQNKLGLPNDQSFLIVDALLQSKKKRIDLNDWINEYSDEEKKLNFRFRVSQSIDQMAMPEMWYYGYGLVRGSKFMILDNISRKIIFSGLTMHIQNKEFGTRTIEFQLPSGLSFWQTINMIGD